MGVAAEVIKAAVDAAFGGSSSSDSTSTNDGKEDSNNDDSSSDYDGQKTGTNAWTVGGSLMSPGPAGQSADLYVYPKDAFGFFFALDSKLLSLSRREMPSEKIAVEWSAVSGGYRGIAARPSVSAGLVIEYVGMSELRTEFDNIVNEVGILSAFSLSHSDVIVPREIPYKERKGEVRLIPRDAQGVARRGPDAAPKEIGVSLVNDDDYGIPPTTGARTGGGGAWIRYNDCLVFPFTLEEPGLHVLRITVAGETVVKDIVGVRGLSLENSIFYGSGLCSGPPGEDVVISIVVHDQNDDEYEDWVNRPDGLKILMAVPGEPGGKPQTKELVPDVADDAEWLSSYRYTRPQHETGYSITVTYNGIPHPRSPFQIEASTDKASTSPARVIPRVSKPRGRPDEINPFRVAVGEQFRFEVRTYDGKGRLWYGVPKHITTGLREDRDVTIDSTKFEGTAKTGWDSGKLVFVRAPVGKMYDLYPEVEYQDGTVIKSKDLVIIAVVGARVLASCTMSGPGLNAIIGTPRASIFLHGLDQYGDPMAPKHGVTCALSVSTDTLQSLEIWRARTNKPGQSRHTYVVPVGPYHGIRASVYPAGNSTFPELFALCPVTSRERTKIDPTKCFIIWDELHPDKFSTAMLYVMTTAGFRFYSGGHVVEAKSLGPNPISFPESVKDNDNGTYTIHMSLPSGSVTGDDEAAAAASTGAVASLEVRINGALIANSPQSFPLPRGAAMSVVGVKMLDVTTDPRDGRQMLPNVKPKQQPRFRFQCVDVYGRPVSGDIVREKLEVVGHIRVPGSEDYGTRWGDVLKKGAEPDGGDHTILWLGFDASDDAGEFALFVTWRGVAVQGSPFKVLLEENSG